MAGGWTGHERQDLKDCGCGRAAFPGSMMRGVLGHYFSSGESPDAWSVATSVSWVWGGKGWEDLEAPGDLGRKRSGPVPLCAPSAHYLLAQR